MESSACATLLDLLLLAAKKGALKKATLSKPTDPTIVRTILTPRLVGGRQVFQAEHFLTDGKAVHKNLPTEDTDALIALLSGYGQINLVTTAGECELRRAKSGKTTLTGAGKLAEKLGGEVETLAVRGNDNDKTHILTGTEPFLRLLGISDRNGRILDSKRAKYRQINRFLEEIRTIVPELPATGVLYVCDLCCGKSYLSFAAYHYLSEILGREVEMTGVDLKKDVIEYCTDVAAMLHFDGLHFVCGDITRFRIAHTPSLVISLHACDTATDVVIGKAIEWNAKVVLSTPCCHHELNHTIHCPPLAFITEHSMLRQKFCDAATDALRLKLLEANGYAVDAVELIDPEETPKNILLRAVKRTSGNPVALAEYETAKKFLLGR